MTVLKVVLSDSQSVRFMCHIDFFKWTFDSQCKPIWKLWQCFI